ncbi:ABC transporter [Zongyangia hominis]|uniref:ABC transporter permease subunit n=1 Tax=Zongyangia hominis TaxID=2763677 RepID=A0A926ICP7_9FIRM|nr:ABC transporter [Zongyangia hominis]MBC8571442.1 ABC transporter permease subunit [Zongyangia hominis]
MTAIFKRELSAYFSSAVGFIFLAVFFAFGGFYFFLGNVLSNTTDMRAFFSSIFSVIMFLIPILTMRLMSEDKKLKTDQALLTAPVGLYGIVLGKYLSAVVVYLAAMAMTVVYAVTLAAFAPIDLSLFFGHLLGAIFLGLALIAIGEFISSLTESQVIAAVASFAVMMALMLIDTLSSVMPTQFLKDVIYGISFYTRYANFTLGVLSIADVIFFLSVAGLFLFFTVRVLEKKRWS